jgi:hypothetical protein
MNSEDLARYIEHVDGMSKPWLLLQLRLAKLKERRHELSDTEYQQELEELHRSLMQMGEWWKGREDQVFRQGL